MEIFRDGNQCRFLDPQNVLRELEQKKPQLDELVHTAENLKAEPNRQQLHGKGRTFIWFLITLVTTRAIRQVSNQGNRSQQLVRNPQVIYS